MKKSSGSLMLLAVALIAVPAHAAYSKATMTGKQNAVSPATCPSGSFWDPRNAGECWSCPSGYDRTLTHAVDSEKACVKPAATTHKKAEFEHAWGCDSDRDEFFDPRKGGECWKCPSNRPRRTAAPVTADNACATKEVIGEKVSEAHFAHKFKGCGGDAFYDPRKGGQCWSCPKGYKRTVSAVTSDTACEKQTDESFESATKKAALCESGFPDPDGNCYTCPSSSPVRSVFAVTSDKACMTKLDCGEGKVEDPLTNTCVSAADVTRRLWCKAAVDAANGRPGPVFKAWQASVGRPSRKTDEAMRKALKAASTIDDPRTKKLTAEATRLHELIVKNRDKYNALFKADSLCGDPFVLEKRLAAAGFKPADGILTAANDVLPDAEPASRKAKVPPLVRASIGANNPHFYMLWGFAASAGVVAGDQIGLAIVTDYQGNTISLVQLGPQLVSNVTASVSDLIQFYPSVGLDTFDGDLAKFSDWDWELSLAAGEVVGGGFDAVYPYNMGVSKMGGPTAKGVGLRFGIEVGLIPVEGGVAASYSKKL